MVVVADVWVVVTVVVVVKAVWVAVAAVAVVMAVAASNSLVLTKTGNFWSSAPGSTQRFEPI